MGNTVIVVGSGAREHALTWKLAQSPFVERLIAVPGNPGTARLAENVATDVLDTDAIVALAGSRGADLVVVGPEAPLATGLADRIVDVGIPVCGPSQRAARIESSKSWAKSIMEKAGVPTARSVTVSTPEELPGALDQFALPVVIKADGLAAGKGVVIAASRAEAVEAGLGIFSGSLLEQTGDSLVIEEFLTGPEVSVLALTDGDTTVPLMPATDYKRAFDDDQGPNTGGMGAFAPVPEITSEVLHEIQSTILEPTVAAMRDAGAPMQGVLYAGLMLTGDGIKVIEFNARFGDPEAEVLLPLLQSDLFESLMATSRGTLGTIGPPCWSNAKAVCVMLASGGYPGSYPKGVAISGIGEDAVESIVFHAGTSMTVDGRLQTAGGRVLAVVGLGDSFESASANAYARADRIAFAGKQFRTDIGARAGNASTVS
jgi:phosphoribosylamine--glycine ligase